MDGKRSGAFCLKHKVWGSEVKDPELHRWCPLRISIKLSEEKMDATNPKDLIGVKKPRLSLVSPAGILYEALAMQNGADKYGPYNWREKKVQAMIYLEAAMRHLMSWQDGEEVAVDSGVPHLAHAKACIGILIDALETDSLIDNRPKKGAMARLIEKFTKKG